MRRLPLAGLHAPKRTVGADNVRKIARGVVAQALSGAILVDSDLYGADHSDNMLVETNFTGVDLRGVKLARTVT